MSIKEFNTTECEARSKFGGSRGLYQQKHNDQMKREYCKKHGYTLVAIPYWEENILNYDYIMKAAYGW